jgi:hypothetical protein
VLNEDSFQRSLNDFNLTMRDLCSLDMGRQRVGLLLYSNLDPDSSCHFQACYFLFILLGKMIRWTLYHYFLQGFGSVFI